MSRLWKVKCDQCGKETEKTQWPAERWVEINTYSKSGDVTITFGRGKSTTKNRFDFCSAECITDYVRERMKE